MNKRIAWIIPLPTAGSGGLRTIFAHAEELQRRGCLNDFFILAADYGAPIDTREVKQNIKDWFSANVNVEMAISIPEEYDAIIATLWSTAYFANMQNIAKKIYFIQGYEPWIYPRGDDYIAAEGSYHLGLRPITIGQWLSGKIADKTGLPAVPHTIFGANLAIYSPLPDIEKENAICAILQPGKYWRMPSFVEEALFMLSELRPNLTIYTYGSNDKPALLTGPSFKHLGIVAPNELNELYNKCQCGVCLSYSNPSRISFEMMATGLPVIELKCEMTSVDLPSEAVAFCDHTPLSLVEKTMMILDNPALQDSMSKAGMEYMRTRSQEIESNEFADAVLHYCNEDDQIDGQATIDSDRLADMRAHAYRVRYEQLLLACTPINAKDVRMEILIDDEETESIKACIWSKNDQADRSVSYLSCISSGRFCGHVNLPLCDTVTPVHIHLYKIKPNTPESFIYGFDANINNATEPAVAKLWDEVMEMPEGKLRITQID